MKNEACVTSGSKTTTLRMTKGAVEMKAARLVNFAKGATMAALARKLFGRGAVRVDARSEDVSIGEWEGRTIVVLPAWALRDATAREFMIAWGIAAWSLGGGQSAADITSATNLVAAELCGVARGAVHRPSARALGRARRNAALAALRAVEAT